MIPRNIDRDGDTSADERATWLEIFPQGNGRAPAGGLQILMPIFEIIGRCAGCAGAWFDGDDVCDCGADKTYLRQGKTQCKTK